MKSSKRASKTSRGGGVHTMPNPDGPGWVNRFVAVTMPPHQRKRTALKFGRAFASWCRTEHTIHSKDGRILEKNSYGEDPHPPRDET